MRKPVMSVLLALMLTGCGMKSSEPDVVFYDHVSMHAPGGAKTATISVGDTVRLSIYVIYRSGDSVSTLASVISRKPNIAAPVDPTARAVGYTSGSTYLVTDVSGLKADSVLVVVR